MIILTRRIRWIIFLLAAAFAAVVTWQMNVVRAVTVARLRNGSELRLVDFRHGRTIEHVAHPTWREHWQSFLQGRTLSKRSARLSFDHDASVLLFSLRNAETGADTDPIMKDVEVFDAESGVRWKAEESHLDKASGGPLTVVRLDCFPRRAAQFRVRCTIGKETVEMTIPNLHRISAAPQWKAEPLPQTRRVGEREYTLTEIHLTPMPANFLKYEKTPGPHFTSFLNVDVHDHGVDAPNATVEYQFEDETGNRAPKFLPASERVWRLRLTTIPARTWDYHADDTWSLGAMNPPDPGEYRVLPIPPGATEYGIVQIVLLGAGHFVCQDGEFTVAEAPIKIIGANVRSPASGHYIAEQSGKSAALMIVRTGEKAMGPLRVVARIKDRERQFDFHSLTGGGGSGRGPDLVGVNFLGTYEEDTRKLTAPVEIQLLNRREDTVEFMFPAPTLEALPAPAPEK